MQFAYDLELSGQVPRGRPFVPADFVDYEEPTEFVDLAEVATSTLKRRVAQIRATPFAT